MRDFCVQYAKLAKKEINSYKLQTTNSYILWPLTGRDPGLYPISSIGCDEMLRV